ncbi:MAG: glucuronate isomerase, partial [Planctomycetaceae bacterium]
MSQQLARDILAELESIVLIDPHTHINPHAPASETLADILGYHYYTELAHSAGLPREQIEAPELSPKEKVGRLIPRLADLDNTVQASWLLEMCREFFGFKEDGITEANWESLFDTASQRMADDNWEEQVLKKSNLEAVFLTNDFDDPLEGFDTARYVPCLRTDDLVFHFARPETQSRLATATGVAVSNAVTFAQAIGRLFEHFTSRGAKACAISLPPDFAPGRISAADAESALQAALRGDEPGGAQPFGLRPRWR